MTGLAENGLFERASQVRTPLEPAESAGQAAHRSTIRCHWSDNAFSFPLLPPFRGSLVRSIERKTKRKRRAKVRTSGRRSGAQRYLLLAISARWTQCPRTFRAGVRKKGMPFPESEALRFLSSLTCLASPLPGRREPVKAASREAVARHAPALTGWRWSGLLGLKQARLGLHSQPQPSRPCE